MFRMSGFIPTRFVVQRKSVGMNSTQKIPAQYGNRLRGWRGRRGLCRFGYGCGPPGWVTSVTVVVTVLPAGKLPASCLSDVVPAELGDFAVAIGVSDGLVWRVAVDAVLTHLQKYDAQIGKPSLMTLLYKALC